MSRGVHKGVQHLWCSSISPAVMMEASRRLSQTSERFMGLVSPPLENSISPLSTVMELQEHEVLWTNSDMQPTASPRATAASTRTLGILAALPEDDVSGGAPLLQRKQTVSPTSPMKSSPFAAKKILTIPRAARLEAMGPATSKSVPGRRMYGVSAPMEVPTPRRPARPAAADTLGEEDDDDEVMLPPHEIVATRSLMATCSVLEGVGRTLKGRDLCRVRNAVLRQTGFLDL